jgi:hypothetical protein
LDGSWKKKKFTASEKVTSGPDPRKSPVKPAAPTPTSTPLPGRFGIHPEEAGPHVLDRRAVHLGEAHPEKNLGWSGTEM